MGEALLRGILDAGWAISEELAVVEPRQARRVELEARYPGLRVSSTPARAGGAVIAVKPGDAGGAVVAVKPGDAGGAVKPGDAGGAVIAVKPGDVEDACKSIAGLGITRCVSIAAGVTLAGLSAWLGPEVAVFRAMPNTPALVGAAATALASSGATSEEDWEWATQVLGSVGLVVRMAESSLDAVTGLSGSGPAYVFLVAEALIDAGVSVGLTHEVSSALVVQTILGAGRLLAESGESPAALRAAVTSPGGTTAAGLRALEAAASRAAFIGAVEAATARSAELGRPTPTPDLP